MELNPVTSKTVAFHTQGIAKVGVFRITEACYGYRRVGWNGIDDGRTMDSTGCSYGEGPKVARIPSKSTCETLVIPTKVVLIMTTKISAHWYLKTCREFVRGWIGIMMIMSVGGWRMLQEREVMDIFRALMVSSGFVISLMLLLVYFRVSLSSLG